MDQYQQNFPDRFLFFPPVSSAVSAESMARKILYAMDQGRADLAAAIARMMGSVYPWLTESHVLLAKSLYLAEHFTQAFHVWNETINQSPLELDWLEQAIGHALSREETRMLDRWVHLLGNIFVRPPSGNLLLKLTRSGFVIKGSAGIHCGQVLVWTWLPEGNSPRVIPPSNLSPKVIHSSARRFGSYILTQFTLSLPESDDFYHLRITDANDQDIQGSPILCSPANSVIGKHISWQPNPAVMIPVYDDKKATCDCLASVLDSQKFCRTSFDIFVVWDHGPDPALLEYLQSLAEMKKITLISTPENFGFLGAINYGLRTCGNRDVVLLNSDTIVNGNWFDRLHRIARSRKKVGTITPMGSYAELVSYPHIRKSADISTREMTWVFDQACQQAAGKFHWHEIPVGVGFCMYITKDLLKNIGGFDGRWVFSGYGEEVDFCLRARKAGFVNLAALNVFVTHLGGRSFGLKKKALAAQNNKALFARYPGYKKEYNEFLAHDPLRNHREAMTLKIYKPLQGPLHILSALDENSPSVLALQDQYKASGKSWAMLILENGTFKKQIRLCVHQEIDLADLSFTLPEDEKKLLKAIERLVPEKLMIHGSNPSLRYAASLLGLPMELYLEYLPPFLFRCWENKLSCPAEQFAGLEAIHCYSSQIYGWLLDAHLPAVLISDSGKEVGGDKKKCLDPETNELQLIGGFLSPPPRTLDDWKALCSMARDQARNQIFFYVPEIESIWGKTPRPSNIIPLDVHNEKNTKILPAQAMLIIGKDPEQRSIWLSWAHAQGISSYLADGRRAWGSSAGCNPGKEGTEVG